MVTRSVQGPFLTLRHWVSSTTNATRRNKFSHFFIYFFYKSHKNIKKVFCSIFVFPQKKTLTDAGDGDGGEITKKTLKKHLFLYFSPEGNFD